MDVLFKDRLLPYTTVRKLPPATSVEDDKTIDARLDEIITKTRRASPPGAVDGSGYAWPDPPTAPPFEQALEVDRLIGSANIGLSAPIAPPG